MRGSLSAIIDYAKKSAIALGVEYGFAHLEIMLTSRGPVLIELGARLHGGIAPLVFEQCYSAGLLSSAVDLLTGQLEMSATQLKNNARIIFLINEKEGATINNHQMLQQLKAITGVGEVKLFTQRNQNIPLTTDLSNCPAIVSIFSTTRAGLDTLEQRVREVFKQQLQPSVSTMV